VAVAAVAGVAIAASAAMAARASLQQDFAAYYTAGRARALGLDPYVNHVGSQAAPALWDGVAAFRHSRFLYPPLVAEVFRPLAALPYAVAKRAFTAASVAALFATAAAAGSGAAPAWLVAGALCFPLHLALDRGQIDLLLLPLLLVAWRARRSAVAGVALGLAAAFKPALLGVVPVLIPLGRARAAVAAAATAVALAALTVVVCGPALARSYVADVLPRAVVYGEGGTEEMLLPDERFPTSAELAYRTTLWDRPTSASLPRLLAPSGPSWPATIAPFVIALAGLVWAARRFGARRAESAALLYLAGLVACVVTSPSGWAMDLVWAMPIVPIALRLRAAGALTSRAFAALGGAWIACALPAPFAGFPALAGAALVVAAVLVASEAAAGASPA